MISNISEISNDLVMYALNLFKQNNIPINELILQKVIYKIKMNLDESHPLYEKIPYYWYYYGSFSETIMESFNNAKIYLDEVGDTFLLKDKHVNAFQNKTIDIFPEIDEKYSNFIFKDVYVYSQLTEDIYKKFSPFNLVYKFKYGIFNIVEKDTFAIDGDKYVDLFRFFQSNFYPLAFFNNFSFIFTKFTSQIDLLNDDNIIGKNWNVIQKPIKNL